MQLIFLDCRYADTLTFLTMAKEKKGILSRIIGRLDEKLEEKSKTCACCESDEKTREKKIKRK